MRVLVIEDEKKLARLIVQALEDENHLADFASDGEEGLVKAKSGVYDVIILDVMLPKRDGINVTRDLRAAGLTTPVIMLTARDTVNDRVMGLDAGADDYMVKPFAFAELLARVRAHGRRVTMAIAPNVQSSPDTLEDVQPKPISPTLTFADLSLDLVRHQVSRAGQRIDLTAKEFTLLEYLMRNPNQVLTRTQITEHVWEYSFDADSNVVDIYIHYLRNKIERNHGKKLIHSVRGVGYILKDE